MPDLIAITGDPAHVVTMADYTAGDLGVSVSDGSKGRGLHALPTAAALHAEGKFVITTARTFPLADGAEAHRLSQSGHVRGKNVVTVP